MAAEDGVSARADLWLLARELAEALARTPEVERFRATEQALLDDPEASSLVRRYEAMQRGLRLLHFLPPEERARRMDAFRAVEREFQANPLIAAHREARAELDRLMARLSDVINYAITGRPAPPARSCGCGGGCGCAG